MIQFHKNSWARFSIEYSEAFGYKLLRKLPDQIQNVILFPFDIFHSVDVFVSNYFVSKIHCLSSKHLKKGQWYELETRLLFCCFGAFEWFVENDMGHTEGQSPEEYWARGLFEEDYPINMITQWRAKDEETKALYYWWKERQKDMWPDFVSLEKEEEFDNIDTEMLCRLMKLRGSLWS